MTKLVKAVHKIHHVKPGDEGEWRETPEGKILIKSKPTVEEVHPGQVFIPHTEAALNELLALGAVVEPDERDVALYERTNPVAPEKPARGRKAAAGADDSDPLA